MKTVSSLCAVAVCGIILLATSATAAPQAKSYQVTGPVLEVTDTFITVKKGEDNWQVARDAGTKITGDHKAESAPKVEKADKTEKTKKK